MTPEDQRDAQYNAIMGSLRASNRKVNVKFDQSSNEKFYESNPKKDLIHYGKQTSKWQVKVSKYDLDTNSVDWSALKAKKKDLISAES